MVTDFLQGQLINITMLAIMLLLLITVGFGTIIEGLQMAPAGESKMNPFDQGKLPDFNVWYFVMLAVMGVYGTMAWQGTQAYNASARTAHEAKMAKILGEFRGLVTFYVIMLLPVAAYAVMHHPSFATVAESVGTQLAGIDDEQVRTQMQVPIVATYLLPVGMMGMFTAVIFAAAISTDDTYLHSWGSIFIQDVVLPFRQRRLSPRMHLRLLRISMVCVAVFAFFFSLFFPLRSYIFMFFHITGAIFLGGAGSVIIGGLYWSRGTAAGAWSAMICGSALAVTGIVVQNILWPVYVGQNIEFPFNGMQVAFFSAVVSISVYVLVSLATCRSPINMDALLHRGEFSIRGEHEAEVCRPVSGWRSFAFTKEFSRGDKVIYVLKMGVFFLFFGTFLVGTIWGLLGDVSDSIWIKYWWFKLIFVVVMGSVTTIWFLLGGFKDAFDLFATLRSKPVDVMDDGYVVEHLGAVQSDSGTGLRAETHPSLDGARTVDSCSRNVVVGSK